MARPFVSTHPILLARWFPINGPAIQPGTNANSGSSTVPLWVSLQQFPQYGNGNYGSGNGVVVHGYPGGDSEYSSLQTKVQKRLDPSLHRAGQLHMGQAHDRRRQSSTGFCRSRTWVRPQDWRNLKPGTFDQPAGCEVPIHRASLPTILPVGQRQSAESETVVSDAFLADGPQT